MDRLSKQLALQVRKSVEVLNRGGIIAYPTDTVYGLGCNAFDTTAVEKIYRVKQRPFNQPLPILLADIAQLSSLVSSVTGVARFLMKRFWPGGLTLVLPKATSVPQIVTAGSDKVAIRIPSHTVPIAIIQQLGAAIIGTSANISEKPSPVTAEGVKQQLGSQVDLIIDAGKCPGGRESTVVDITSGTPVILREGIIPAEAIKKACLEYAER
ncbi:MAG TPA: threonylcarbamoyl-AMP synthase [Dehalococcoidia bacterium]|nr:threonylcarbamoyl-AMP synthase [Dehalococcoidia bacterium]